LGGCSDPEIEALVCAQQFFCCTGEWDESCVKLLGELEDQGTLTYQTDDMSRFPGSSIQETAGAVTADIPLPADQKADTKVILLPKLDLPAGQKYLLTLDATEIPAGSTFKVWIGNDPANMNNKKFSISPVSPAVFKAAGTVTLTSDKPGQFWVLAETEQPAPVGQTCAAAPPIAAPKISVKQTLVAAGNSPITPTTNNPTTVTNTAPSTGGTSINFVFSGLLK